MEILKHETPWRPEKSSITFFEKDNLTVVLAYDWNSQEPKATVVYWENKGPKECYWKFEEKEYGRYRINSYWKQILKLNEYKLLNLETVCHTVEDILLSEEPKSPLKFV